MPDNPPVGRVVRQWTPDKPNAKAAGIPEIHELGASHQSNPNRGGKLMWSSGSPVLYREVTHGKVWTARPVRVIQDTPELIALFLREGTPWKVCAPADSQTDLVYCKANLSPWQLQDVIWTHGDTVILIFPGTAYAVHVMWDWQQRFSGWYVNLQEPVRSTRLGLDFLDQELDLVVSPDLSWRWKDTAHLERAQAIGLFSVAQVRAIRQDALRVIDRIRVKAVPFDGSWNHWRPPTEWPLPCLPEGWDQVD